MACPRVHRHGWRTAGAAAGLLLAGLLLALGSGAQAAHSPLVLRSDAEIAAHAHEGSGTPGDPYRIRGLVLSAAQSHGVVVQGTRAHLVLDGVVVSTGGGNWDGIRLQDVRNVTVAGSLMEGTRAGVAVVDSRDVAIERTTVKTSRVGVQLERATSVRLAENRLSVNDKDVSLRDSPGNAFHANNLTIATGQFGFFFEDPTSYRNEIGTSNVVNFLPVRWYVHPCPATLADVGMELKGATNVAQVMLHGCQGTTVDGLRAKDGAGAGVHVLGGNNVTLLRATVEGNAGTGVLLDGGADAWIAGATVRANGAGIHLKAHDRARLEDVTLESNRADGLVAFPGSDHLSMLRLATQQNLGRGVVVERSEAPSLLDARVLSNRATGVHLLETRNATVSGSRILDNAGPGIHLVASNATVEGNAIAGQPQQVRFGSASRGSDVRLNNLSLRPNDVGLHFDDTASYANRVETTNLVDGTPLRWYHAVSGTPEAPFVITGFNASVPGATNVAQVMVHESRHVVVARVNATRGVADGILVHGSQDVWVTGSHARENARDGIRAEGSHQVRVHESDATANRRDGVVLLRTPAGSLENVRAEGNHARGVLVESSPLATLRGIAAVANRGAGIHVLRAHGDPVHVENNLVRANAGGGLLLHDSSVSVVRANTILDNGPDGLHLAAVPAGATVVENDVRNHTRGIHLAGTKGQDFRSNRVTILPGQTGFHFGDDASHNNSVDTSNVVNDVPMRWYNEVRRTAGDPLRLEGVRVELKGITNVAQVMLRNVQNVTLQDLLAANGTHRGVVVAGSANVSLLASRVEANGLDGLRVAQSKDLWIHGTTLADNRGVGLHLVQDDRARLDSVTVRNATGVGLRAESTGLLLQRATLVANGEAGLVVGGSHPDPLRVSNATVLDNRGPGAVVGGVRVAAIEDGLWQGNGQGGLRVDGSEVGGIVRNVLRHNGDHGIRLSGARPGGLLAENLVVNHTQGVSLAGTRGWHLRDNDVRLGEGRFGFFLADEASYENQLPVSNTVNGTSVRWYQGLRGPLTLPGVVVEQRGITNVAQVMLHDVADLVLEAPVAANGTGHGILLHKSTNVTLREGRVENNSGDGVSILDGGGRHQVRGAAVRGNGGHGVVALRSGGHEVNASVVEDNGGAGVRFAGRTSLNAVTGSRIAGNRLGGVELDDPLAPRVLGNVLERNGPFGVSLARAANGPRVEDNRLHDHAKGIRLAGTEYAEIHRNRLTLMPGQTGLHFEDEASYNNVIPTTNTVNGTSVQWHVGLTGTESSPVVLRDVKVEQPGITNVAQVMLYRSSYVTMENVTASRGVARGIELYHSSSIRLLNVTAAGNQDGVQLKSTQSSQLRDVRAAGNVRGVKLVASGNNLLAGTLVTGSEVGILVSDQESRSNRIEGTEAAGVRTASVQDPSVNALRGNNLVADAGLDRRVLVNRTLVLDGGIATYRFETERIAFQRWEFGDNESVESLDPVPLRPEHVYREPGRYRANFTMTTVHGATLRDSLWVTVMPPLTEPLGLRAAIGDRNVTLHWAPPASDGASPVTKYRVWRAPEGGEPALLAETGPDARTFLDTKDLVNGRAYRYAVSAVNADGEGPRSAPADASPAAPPGPPRNVAARPTQGTVTLTWDAPADDGGRPIVGYRVLRGPTGRDLVPYADAGAASRWTDALVGSGIHYSYAVVAYNAIGPGKPSANVSAVPTPPPPAPVNLRALPSDRVVTLVWDVPERPGDGPVTHYRVLRGDDPENLTQLATPTGRVFGDVTALPARTYHYAVVAVNPMGESPRSDVVATSLQAEDRLRPIFLAKGPAPGVPHVNATEAWAEYLDNLGVVPGKVRIEVDGVDVTDRASVTDRGVRYAAPAPFPLGDHTVRVTLEDAAGNAAEEAWTFRVVDPATFLPRWEWSDLNVSAAEVTLGESVLVQARVRNVGGSAGTVVARLLADNASAADRTLGLEPGNDTLVAFRYKPAAAGLVNLTIGDQPPLALRVVPDKAAPAGARDGAPAGAMPLPEDAEGEAEEEKNFLPGPGPALLLAVGALAAALLPRWRPRGR